MSEMPPEVLYEVDDRVAWLTINRPEARNALNKAVRDGLKTGIEKFNADDSAAVLIITGAGDKSFCAGGDLKEMTDTALKIPPKDFVVHLNRTIQVEKPVIAAVNGYAFAGGFLLAQQVDLCIASDNAKFGVTEVKVGRGAPWASPLPWIIGPRLAMEILLTGAADQRPARLRDRLRQQGRPAREPARGGRGDGPRRSPTTRRSR